MIIYKIQNKINNKIYIGQSTCPLAKRKREHKCVSNKLNYPLYNSIKKYGLDNFEFSIILDNIEDQYKLDEWEKIFIKVYKSHINDGGYNLQYGGNGRGKHSKESIKKMSDAKRGKKRSKETIKKMSKSMKGKKHKPETIKKLRDLPNKGKYLKGVVYIKSRNKFEARIRINGKCLYLGQFETEKEAHEAYKNAYAGL